MARANGKLRVECFIMSNPAEPPSQLERTQLEGKLHEVDQQLRSQMLARGFDPDQDDNVALTAPLAKLYMEREKLRARLQELSDEVNLTG